MTLLALERSVVDERFGRVVALDDAGLRALLAKIRDADGRAKLGAG